jgi:hypothetical protein
MSRLVVLASSLIRSALISIAAAAVFFAVLIVLALFAPQDQQTIRRHLADAIAGGEMISQTTLGPLATAPVYRAMFDCLQFGMLLAPAESGRAAAMSNRRPVAEAPSVQDARVPPFPDCQTLVRAFPELGGDGVGFIQYDRYLLGMRVAGRVLLSMAPLPAMRGVLRGTAYGLLAIIAITALWRLVRSRDPIARERAAGHGAVAACLALFFCMHYFDATLTFGPMDCVQYLFILISLVCPLGSMSPGRLALYGASYGSLIAIFEFLTGGITLALALSPLLLALGNRGDRASYLARLITLWGCFCVAVVAMFALKKLYTVALLGDSDNFIAALLHRTYGATEGEAIVTYSLSNLLIAYYRGSSLIGWGSSRFGALLVAVSLATIALVWWRGPQSAHLRFAAALSLTALAAWIVVFLNHSILHAFFMARFLVIPPIVAAVLTATALAARENQRHLPVPG